MKYAEIAQSVHLDEQMQNRVSINGRVKRFECLQQIPDRLCSSTTYVMGTA